MVIPLGRLAQAVVTIASGLAAYASPTPKSVFLAHAMNATDVLNQRWYSSSSGLWQDFWWNSGATLATIGNVALVNDDFKATASEMFSDILVTAKASNRGTFLNKFFDDEGWWAMGWIKAFDVTKEGKYLVTAQEIFKDMLTGQGAKCGGIWWSKDRVSNSAISNQLFLAVAASLANRVKDEDHGYREIAQKQEDGLPTSGMMNENNTFNDGLDTSNCQLMGPVYSYNQGVILGGLVEMHKLTGHNEYLDKARDIALGAIEQLATPNHGILTDKGYPEEMDSTGAQFKGVLLRNLMELQAISGREEFLKFIQQNADSVWEKARQKDGQFGALWQGPVKSLSAAAQVSALDCLIAAAAVSAAGKADGEGQEASGSGSIATVTAVVVLTRTAGPTTRTP